MQIFKRDEDVRMDVRTQPRRTLLLDYGEGAPEVKVLINDETTVAFVEVELFGDTLQATGSSKKHPKDVHDQDVGVAYAVSRAFISMAHMLEREARMRVDSTDRYRRWNRFSTAVEEFNLEPLAEPVYEEKEPHPKQDPNNRTKEELRLACRRKGLSTSGTKQDMIDRLEEYDQWFGDK